MDVNCDGVVTLEEFIDCCRTDDIIARSITVFDTSFWPCTFDGGEEDCYKHKRKHPSTYHKRPQQSKNQEQQQQQQQEQQEYQPTASTEQKCSSYPIKSPISGSEDRKKLSIDGVASLSRLHKHKKRIKENFLNSTTTTASSHITFQSLPPIPTPTTVQSSAFSAAMSPGSEDSQSSFCRHCVRSKDEILHRYQSRFNYYDEVSRKSGGGSGVCSGSRSSSKSESNLVDKAKFNGDCLVIGVGINISDSDSRKRHTTTVTRKEYLNAGAAIGGTTLASTTGILKNKYFTNNNNNNTDNNNTLEQVSKTTTTSTTDVTTSTSLEPETQGNLQAPDSPSLVKVRSWYTMSKQGVSC